MHKSYKEDKVVLKRYNKDGEIVSYAIESINLVGEKYIVGENKIETTTSDIYNRITNPTKDKKKENKKIMI